MEKENQICADPKCGHKEDRHKNKCFYVINTDSKGDITLCPCKKFKPKFDEKKFEKELKNWQKEGENKRKTLALGWEKNETPFSDLLEHALEHAKEDPKIRWLYKSQNHSPKDTPEDNLDLHETSGTESVDTTNRNEADTSTLSDKIHEGNRLIVADVREFIKRLKKEINIKSDNNGMIHYSFIWQEIIDQIFGEKLT